MKTLSKALLIAVVLSQIGCGTIIYPERRFQHRTGRIDPVVVGMDAAWMLLFIVPGAVALLVDFTTGAMYLPEGHRHFFESRSTARRSILPVERGTQLEVRTPDGASKNARWQFELHRPASPVVLASWSWSKGSGITIRIPDSLAGGTYEMRVIRDGDAVGRLPIHIHG